MTKETLAAQLNGRQIGKEITDQEESVAKASGLVVLFGASDDLAEFRGAINDETGCCPDDGKASEILIVDGKILPDHDDCDCEYCGYAELKKRAIVIKAHWCDGDTSWSYSADFPHTDFFIMEEADKYCRGIVFDLASLK